jgi:hypothetical protein
VDLDGTVRLIGVILIGTPSLPLAVCRHHDPRGYSTTGSTVIPASNTASAVHGFVDLCSRCPSRWTD